MSTTDTTGTADTGGRPHGDTDRLIREALERADMPDFSDPPLHEMLLSTFRGRMRWLNIAAFVEVLIFFGLALFCGSQALEATELRDVILWATGFLICMNISMMIKIWYWLEMQRNSLRREIKRLELHVAQKTIAPPGDATE